MLFLESNSSIILLLNRKLARSIFRFNLKTLPAIGLEGVVNEKNQVVINIEGTFAELICRNINDQEVNTLVLDFGEGCRMLSTTCGYKVLSYVANHYIPSSLWEHNLDYDQHLTEVLRSLQLEPKDTAMLVTGVDMDNFSYKYSRHEELKIGCFVTAGTKSNALRMGVDQAQVDDPGRSPSYPGTINVILFTIANFTDGAMAMAMINITEAKAGALQDLKVHSVYTPDNIATGTGTDGIIVVSGRRGPVVASTSWHLKIGELIGKTVREAVIEALQKQEGLELDRGSRPVMS
jgi:adenosylcobinamide amidohydrolase